MRSGVWCSHSAAGSVSIRHPYNRAGHASGQSSGDDGAQAQADHLGPPLGRHGSQAADHDSRTGGVGEPAHGTGHEPGTHAGPRQCFHHSKGYPTMKNTCFLLVCALGLTGLALADQLILHNGAVVTGTYVGGDARSVHFVGPDGNVQTYAVGNVSSIRFATPPTAAHPAVPVPPAVPATRPAPVRPPVPPVPVARPAPVRPPAPAPRRAAVVPSPRRAARSQYGVTVPAGTLIRVRLIDAIYADVRRVGQRFRARIDSPVRVGGRTVIPRYADATVQVMGLERSSRRQGRGEVALKLHDITLGEWSYPVATNYAEGQRKRSRTARNRSTSDILADIFSGARGAGTGITDSTLRGTRLQIPSRSRLKFVLRAPLEI